MAQQFILRISLDGQEMDCIPNDANESGLGLDQDGITWKEKSFAAITVDNHHELVITNTSDVSFTLKRDGRTCQLECNNPRRILAGDEILWNTSKPHRLCITKIYRSNKILKSLGKLSKHAMFASAAAMLIGVIPGCDVSPNREVGKMPAKVETVPEVDTNQVPGEPPELPVDSVESNPAAPENVPTDGSSVNEFIDVPQPLGEPNGFREPPVAPDESGVSPDSHKDDKTDDVLEEEKQQVVIGGSTTTRMMGVPARRPLKIHVFAKPLITGTGLDKNIINKIYLHHSGELSSCYEKSLVKGEESGGKLRVVWDITPQGTVNNVSIKDSELNNKNVEDCISECIKHWRYPATKNGSITHVEYPFEFEEKEHED